LEPAEAVLSGLTHLFWKHQVQQEQPRVFPIMKQLAVEKVLDIHRVQVLQTVALWSLLNRHLAVRVVVVLARKAAAPQYKSGLMGQAVILQAQAQVKEIAAETV
jgi:hypothetical protein